MRKDIQIIPVTFDSNKESLLRQCTDLYSRIWKEPPWNEDFWTPEKVLRDMEKELAMPYARCFMAINKLVVGFTWGYSVSKNTLREISKENQLDVLFSTQSRVYYIDELGVDLSHRGRGVGMDLTSNLVEHAKLHGHTIVALRTDKQAVEARKVYTKLGFTEQLVADAKYPDRTYWILSF